ncbi:MULTISPECIES: hypothetical protein [Rodentibacter]|uniref:Uncharacterized protein n=1 Tax=Rodentibacter genomosp. 2 TaxID=1908266 RepID=A0A1V3JT01_9PAST|nr:MULTISPECIES: hypothetical protein [Pasteurellaceae]MCX2960483.1 hypothetical protein [Rodentibacter heylii]OOF59571.1 hypothetical protein BKK55_00185 [Rodentibacter genomosp. 2]QIA75988.1 hypothetical protein FEE42_00710 [Rodentibacter heylii]TGY49356.1 hypothetical protein E5343_07095 [Pasteurella caecimuris]
MKYYNGSQIKLGDKASVPGDIGTIVAIISDNLFMEGYEFFSYLKTGLLVDFPKYGLTYYEDKPEDDLELVKREGD